MRKISCILLAISLLPICLSAQVVGDKMLDSLNSLISDTIMLGDVVVTGKKPFMTIEDDKFVYNISGTTISNAGDATDVLRRTPYVITDIDGTISLAGRDKTLILINGRQIRSENELKLINSSRIQQIEIIDNPSAKYEAEGHGVINIITKKGIGDGLNGSVTLNYSQGKRGKTSLIPELSYEGEKLHVYASVNGEKGGEKSIEKSMERYQKEDYHFSAQKDHIDEGDFEKIGYTIDVQYDINKNGNIDAYFDGFADRADELSKSNMFITKNFVEFPTSYLEKNIFDKSRQNSMGLNYYHKWDSGVKLTVLGNYTIYSIDSHDDISERDSGAAADSMKFDFNNNYKLYSIKSDLTVPVLKSKGKFDFGFKFSDVRSESGLDFNRLIDGIWITDSVFSNDVLFQERLFAAYAMFSFKVNRFSYNVGVRGEYTNTDNISENNNTLNNNLQFFPNIAVGYQITDKTTCRLTVSRRIIRPGYSSLNNSMIYINSLSTRHGNPWLKPTMYNSVAFNLSHNKMLFGGLSFSYIEDPTNLMYVNDSVMIENYTLYYDNVKNTWSVSVNVGCSFDLTSWWHIQPSTSFSYSPVVIVDDGVEYEFRYPAYYFNFINQFSLPDGWNLDFNVKFYRPAQGMRKRGKRLDTDFSFSKKLFKDKLTIQGLVKYDFFTSFQVFEYSYKYQSNDYDYNSRYLFQISLKYNFGLKKINHKIESSSTDEIKRF